MSEIGKRILAIVNAGLTPCLKGQGFRKHGVNYYRIEGNGAQVLTVQSSQWNRGDSGRFRVNFGVHFPEVAKILHGSDRMPKIPSEAYCLLRAIWSIPDRWWTVEPATIAANLVLNLGEYWQATIWPWLKANERLPEAAKTLEKQPVSRMAAAAARLTLGEHDEAVRLVKLGIADFESALQSQSTHPANVELIAGHLKTLREWAAAYHLL